MLLAETTPDIPWHLTGTWMLGLIGVLAVVYLVLGVIGQAIKLFGKQPPVNEQLSIMKREWKDETERVGCRCDKRHEALNEHIEQRFSELTLGHQRTLGDLHEKINSVAADVAFIRGKLSTKEI